MLGTSDETKELLLKGTFRSYENCVYLAGACNVGKSTLASILIGEEIPTEWISTDGLNIYFGRNGIDLKKKEMVPLNQGNTSKHLVNILQNGQKNLKISYCYKKYFS
jgi:tRNA A37 N6-isopentenylltransferase MiaA